MAFPSVASRSTGSSGIGTSLSAHPITLPAGAGTADGVLVVFTCDSGPASSTGSSGWSKLGGVEPGAAVGGAVYWKPPGVAASALTINTAFAEESTHIGLRITGADAAASPTLSSATGLTAAGDPPSHTPGGAARDFLWVAALCKESANVASSAPSGFANLTTSTSGASGASTTTAERSLNGTSLDPGAFGGTGQVEDWVAWTIAIAPGVVVPTVGAGADIASHKTQVELTRTATENGNGNPITARSWTITAGPTGVGTTIGTTAALTWTPTVAGDYTLQYSATSSSGTGTGTVAVSVYAPGQFVIFDGEAAPSTDVASTSGFSFGTEFYVTDPAIYAVGIRWPRATTAATPDSARIEKVDGTVVAGTALTLSGGTVGAWNVTNFAARVLLVEGQRYRTVVHYPGNYPGLKTWSPEGRKDGPLESPTNAAATGGTTSRYVTGSPIASPTITYADVLWSDVVVEADSSVIEVSPAGIPSAEAFGAGAVVPGPVAVTAPGTPSGEAFGAGRVTLTITSPGIPSGEVVPAPAVVVAGVVVAGGIASAEAFGAGTITAGPVGVSGSGIASGEIVPVSSVQLGIYSAGIASAEAVGAGSALIVGPVTTTATGIGSAETFGAHMLAPGPVAVTSPGIPSGEAHGMHRVALTLYGVGIPSAETVLGGVLLPGPISIYSPSITSAEAVGFSTLVVTLDTSVRGLRPSVRLTPKYELLVMARIPRPDGPPAFQLADPIDWTKLRWGSTVSKAQNLSITCKRSSITEDAAQRIRNPHTLPTELWLLRNGRQVLAGPLLGAVPRGEEITFEAGGLLTYLHWMIALTDKRFDQADQFTIAAWLIDQWQSVPHYHFGIDTTQVGTSGKLRDREYVRDEQHPIAERLAELGAVRDGFDAEIDPTTRQLTLWTPTKGVDRSAGEDAIVFDGSSIDGDDGLMSIAPNTFGTVAFGSSTASGSETTLWSEQPNEELIKLFGGAAITGSWSNISEQATLDDHVAALLDARDQPLRAPPRRVRVTPDTDLDRYDVGDTVDFQLDPLLGIGGAYRIRSRQVTVDDTGQELVDLEFV